MSKHNISGFTLVEVLIAITILAIGILAWSSSQTQNIKSRSLSEGMTTAIEIAQSKMEDVSAEVSNWTRLHNGTQGSSNISLDIRDYEMSWVVEKGGEMVSGGRAVWEIEVQVNWDQYQNHSVSMKRVVIGK